MTPNETIQRAQAKIREHLEEAEAARHQLRQRLASEPDAQDLAEGMADALEAAARVARTLAAYLEAEQVQTAA